MKGFIQFGGFYGSEHAVNIDNMIESYFDENDYSHIDIDYEAIYNAYSKMWLEYFNSWLISEYNIDLKLVFIGVNSPKEYNFLTDSIEVECNKSFKKLITDEVIKYINDNSKSYDGFISFHEGYNEVKKDKKILFDYVMQYYANEYNNGSFDNDYDVNYGYELLNNLDFIL